MNHRGLHILAISLLAVSALARPALAQGSPGGGYQPDLVKALTWPPELAPPGTYHSAHFGYFYGDVSPDGVIHADASVYMLYQPQFHDVIFEITPAGKYVLAIAPVEGAGESDPWGVAMATTDDEVMLYEHPGPATVIAGGAAWSGVSFLRAADLDGAGKGDLIVATPGAVRLLVHDGVGWSSPLSIPVSGTVFDLAAVDWDADGIDDVAVLNQSCLTVYDGGTGLPIDFFAGSAPSGQIAAIPSMTGYSHSRLAWAFPAGSNRLLLVCNPGGSRQNCGAFPAKPAALASATYTDGSGGRRVDLATSAEADLYLRYFEHQTSGYPYLPGAPDTSVQAGTTLLAGACRFAFRDISGDKVPDILISRPGDDTTYFIAGIPMTFGGKSYPPDELPPFIEPRMVSVDNPGTLDDEYWFQTHVELPQDLGAYTHVQIQTWRSGDGVELDPQGIANQLYPIGDPLFWPDPELPSHDPPISNATHMRLAVLLEDVALCDATSGYYFTMRLVTLENGRPNTGSQAVDAGFTNSQAIVDQMQLNGQPWLTLLDNHCNEGIAPAVVKNPNWAHSSTPPVPKPPQVQTQMPPFL